MPSSIDAGPLCEAPADASACVTQKLAGNDKPILLFFNQPWCGACNHLKNNLKLEGAKLKHMSENFLLINVAGEDNNSFDVSSGTGLCKLPC